MDHQVLVFYQDVFAHQSFPQEEVFPEFVVLKKVNFLKIIIELGLALPFFNCEKGSLLVQKVRNSSRADCHILFRVAIVKLNYLVIVGVVSLVQVAKLVSHFRISSDQINEIHGRKIGLHCFLFLLSDSLFIVFFSFFLRRKESANQRVVDGRVGIVN